MLLHHHSGSAWLSALPSGTCPSASREGSDFPGEGSSLAQGGSEMGKWEGAHRGPRPSAGPAAPGCETPVLHDASDSPSSTWDFRETAKAILSSGTLQKGDQPASRGRGVGWKQIQTAVSHCRDAGRSSTEGSAPKGQVCWRLPNIKAWHVLGCVPLGGTASPSPAGTAPD